MASRGLAAEILGIAWRSYVGQLQREPLLTKAVTAGVLSVVSEVVARRLSGQPLKSSSALHELTVGLVLRGPVIHWFHTLLEAVVFRRARDHAAPHIVLAKLAIDQLLFAPLFIAAYMYLSGLMNDVPLRVTSARLRRELVGVLKSNWVVWVPANFFSYYCVPVELRVAFGSVIGVFWTAILIGKLSKSPPAVRDVDGPQHAHNR
jgi:peroxisomal membrane protein 2